MVCANLVMKANDIMSAPLPILHVFIFLELGYCLLLLWLEPVTDEELEVVEMLLVVVNTLLATDGITDEQASAHSIGASKVLLVANVGEAYCIGSANLQMVKAVRCTKM